MRVFIIFAFCLLFSRGLWAEEGKPSLREEVEALKASLKKVQSLIEAQDQVLKEMEEEKVLWAEEREALKAQVDALAGQSGKENPQGNQQEGLEKEIEGLLAGPKEEPQPAPALPQLGQRAVALSTAILNPNISVIGDFVGNFTDADSPTDIGVEGGDRFRLREVEIGFQGVLDPYSRYDLFVSKPDGEDIEIEEGYVTFLTLPFSLQAKVGKFRQNFGKLNRIHSPERPQVDFPNVLQNFFGEEGLVEEGVHLSYLIPNPWNLYLEASLEVTNGDNETVFGQGEENSDPLYLAHLKSFYDLSEDKTLEVGLSALTGKNEETDQRTNMAGLDITYRWRPLREALYKSFVFQNEFLFSHREKDSLDALGDVLSQGDNDVDSWGMFSLAEYKLSRRWDIGARFDYSQFPTTSEESETAFSTYLNFWLSEFVRLRLQHKYTNRTFENDSHEVFLQISTALGPHRPEPY